MHDRMGVIRLEEYLLRLFLDSLYIHYFSHPIELLDHIFVTCLLICRMRNISLSKSSLSIIGQILVTYGMTSAF